MVSKTLTAEQRKLKRQANAEKAQEIRLLIRAYKADRSTAKKEQTVAARKYAAADKQVILLTARLQKYLPVKAPVVNIRSANISTPAQPSA